MLWLDSASAAVTRTAVAIRQTFGPGVHFIESKEYIAGTLDLHIQTQSLGPKESDKPFAPKSDDQTDDEYRVVQDRCKQVSALTRDGIEIVPKISVNFRVNTGFPLDGQPGSRFGYRIGVTKKDKEREEQDKDAIRRAILGEGVNPLEIEQDRRRVAWNRLPVLLAVDLWREYVGKFTLDELFSPTQVIPVPEPKMPEPTAEEIDLLSRPVRVGATRENMQNMVAGMLHQINGWMEKTLEGMEGTRQEKTKTPTAGFIVSTPASPNSAKSEPQKKTALFVINEMVKARLTKPEVDYLDDNGRCGEGTLPSPEYQLLQERGLQVLSVGISGLMLNPTIEETIIKRWSTTWLKNAKSESEQIERKKSVIESAAREQAIRQYAYKLSQEIIQKKPVGVKETLRTLLMRTRALIFNNDQLRKRMTAEQQELEEIIKWIEVSGP